MICIPVGIAQIGFPSWDVGSNNIYSSQLWLWLSWLQHSNGNRPERWVFHDSLYLIKLCEGRSHYSLSSPPSTIDHILSSFYSHQALPSFQDQLPILFFLISYHKDSQYLQYFTIQNFQSVLKHWSFSVPLEPWKLGWTSIVICHMKQNMSVIFLDDK